MAVEVGLELLEVGSRGEVLGAAGEQDHLHRIVIEGLGDLGPQSAEVAGGEGVGRRVVDANDADPIRDGCGRHPSEATDQRLLPRDAAQVRPTNSHSVEL